jgi:hypothetical protein
MWYTALPRMNGLLSVLRSPAHLAVATADDVAEIVGQQGVTVGGTATTRPAGVVIWYLV